MASHLPSKTCATCGREFTWRKRWARCWEEVRYCGQACRRGPDDQDTALERAIRQLLETRDASASICPSEAARLVAANWRDLMEPARRAARRLVAQGYAEITQGGVVVDPSRCRGPIRIRRRDSPPSPQLSARRAGAAAGTARTTK